MLYCAQQKGLHESVTNNPFEKEYFNMVRFSITLSLPELSCNCIQEKQFKNTESFLGKSIGRFSWIAYFA